MRRVRASSESLAFSHSMMTEKLSDALPMNLRPRVVWMRACKISALCNHPAAGNFKHAFLGQPGVIGQGQVDPHAPRSVGIPDHAAKAVRNDQAQGIPAGFEWQIVDMTVENHIAGREVGPLHRWVPIEIETVDSCLMLIVVEAAASDATGRR